MSKQVMNVFDIALVVLYVNLRIDFLDAHDNIDGGKL